MVVEDIVWVVFAGKIQLPFEIGASLSHLTG